MTVFSFLTYSRFWTVYYFLQPFQLKNPASSNFYLASHQLSYAGINLTGYHLPPGHPGAFAPKRVPSPRAFAQQKMPGAGQINDDVPGAGHLHQLAFKHENC